MTPAVASRLPATSAAIDHGLRDPLPRALADSLRAAVARHAASERRRAFAPVLHVGLPDAVWTALPLEDAAADDRLDPTLRTDLVEAMVRRVRRPGPSPFVWLTRRGELTLQDVDLSWLTAARQAGDELGVRLPMVVVNRRCWRDPATGVGRTWQRLRTSPPT